MRFTKLRHGADIDVASRRLAPTNVTRYPEDMNATEPNDAAAKANLEKAAEHRHRQRRECDVALVCGVAVSGRSQGRDPTANPCAEFGSAMCSRLAAPAHRQARGKAS